ncbi:hypothetical protein CBR_g40014 [Chara braunii]|uniref:Uncharacterized protein n=1 Tax=Chara braunii TaxID=69332 RepID=A0A388LSY8_CHABU|nr:hypothetical protein CBR_g40014 [Chara braunii]|eukprot:GBG85371.1 hypothetical protein CBR_g40014 [Chara braunii]
MATCSIAGSCTCFSALIGNRRRYITLVLIGLDNAGKTTLLSNIRREFPGPTVPTWGFVSRKWSEGQFDVTFYDLGGSANIRRIWEQYYAEVHGGVFVVDASDRSRLHEARDLLLVSMSHPYMLGKPFLIFANKQDVCSALTDVEVALGLNLKVVEGSKHLVVPCSAHATCPTGQGQSVLDERIWVGLRWLLGMIERDFVDLDLRAKQEGSHVAKLKAIAEEQGAKMKELEEEMEKKKKAVEEQAAAEAEEERKRREVKGESSGTTNEDAAMEKKISEWIANLSLGEDEEEEFYVPQDERDALANELAAIEDPLERQEVEEEKKLEWKLRMKREKKRRREEVNRLTAEVAKVRDCRQEVQAQTDMSAKMDKMLGYLEVLSAAWMEERQASWGQDVALKAMRSGFRDFARDIVSHVGGEVRRLRDIVGKFCEGAIEGAKAVAAHILTKEQVLVAFQALKDEAASFARSLARAAGCENNLVAYSKVTPLPHFFKLLRERFTDPTRGVRVSDKLRTIHSRQWRSARALKGVMDDLVAVPDHGVTEPQLVQLFYRAMPEPLRGHFFERSQQADITYDVLSREVVLYESKSMPVSTFWHKDLDKGKKWKGRTISGQVRAKDHMILTLEEGGTDEIPYSEIEWGLEEDDNSVGQGRSYAAVAAGGRPQGRGGGEGQRGQATGGRGPGAQGVGGQGNR